MNKRYINKIYINKLFQVRKQKIPLDTFMNLRSAMYQRGFTYGYQKHSPAEIVRKFRSFKNQKLFSVIII